MLIQLPNGKTVSMSVEAYLALDDSDIKYMVSTNCGSIASSPWCGSAVIGTPDKVRITDEDENPEDTKGLSIEELELDEEKDWMNDKQDEESPESE